MNYPGLLTLLTLCTVRSQVSDLPYSSIVSDDAGKGAIWIPGTQTKYEFKELMIIVDRYARIHDVFKYGEEKKILTDLVNETRALSLKNIIEGCSGNSMMTNAVRIMEAELDAILSEIRDIPSLSQLFKGERIRKRKNFFEKLACASPVGVIGDALGLSSCDDGSSIKNLQDSVGKLQDSVSNLTKTVDIVLTNVDLIKDQIDSDRAQVKKDFASTRELIRNTSLTISAKMDNNTRCLEARAEVMRMLNQISRHVMKSRNTLLLNARNLIRLSRTSVGELPSSSDIPRSMISRAVDASKAHCLRNPAFCLLYTVDMREWATSMVTRVSVSFDQDENIIVSMFYPLSSTADYRLVYNPVVVKIKHKKLCKQTLPEIADHYLVVREDKVTVTMERTYIKKNAYETCIHGSASITICNTDKFSAMKVSRKVKWTNSQPFTGVAKRDESKFYDVIDADECGEGTLVYVSHGMYFTTAELDLTVRDHDSNIIISSHPKTPAGVYIRIKCSWSAVYDGVTRNNPPSCKDNLALSTVEIESSGLEQFDLEGFSFEVSNVSDISEISKINDLFDEEYSQRYETYMNETTTRSDKYDANSKLAKIHLNYTRGLLDESRDFLDKSRSEDGTGSGSSIMEWVAIGMSGGSICISIASIGMVLSRPSPVPLAVLEPVSGLFAGMNTMELLKFLYTTEPVSYFAIGLTVLVGLMLLCIFVTFCKVCCCKSKITKTCLLLPLLMSIAHLDLIRNDKDGVQFMFEEKGDVVCNRTIHHYDDYVDQISQCIYRNSDKIVEAYKSSTVPYYGLRPWSNGACADVSTIGIREVSVVLCNPNTAQGQRVDDIVNGMDLIKNHLNKKVLELAQFSTTQNDNRHKEEIQMETGIQTVLSCLKEAPKSLFQGKAMSFVEQCKHYEGVPQFAAQWYRQPQDIYVCNGAQATDLAVACTGMSTEFSSSIHPYTFDCFMVRGHLVCSGKEHVFFSDISSGVLIGHKIYENGIWQINENWCATNSEGLMMGCGRFKSTTLVRSLISMPGETVTVFNHSVERSNTSYFTSCSKSGSVKMTGFLMTFMSGVKLAVSQIIDCDVQELVSRAVLFDQIALAISLISIAIMLGKLHADSKRKEPEAPQINSTLNKTAVAAICSGMIMDNNYRMASSALQVLLTMMLTVSFLVTAWRNYSCTRTHAKMDTLTVFTMLIPVVSCLGAGETAAIAMSMIVLVLIISGVIVFCMCMPGGTPPPASVVAEKYTGPFSSLRNWIWSHGRRIRSYFCVKVNYTNTNSRGIVSHGYFYIVIGVSHKKETDMSSSATGNASFTFVVDKTSGLMVIDSQSNQQVNEVDLVPLKTAVSRADASRKANIPLRFSVNSVTTVSVSPEGDEADHPSNIECSTGEVSAKKTVTQTMKSLLDINKSEIIDEVRTKDVDYWNRIMVLNKDFDLNSEETILFNKWMDNFTSDTFLDKKLNKHRGAAAVILAHSRPDSKSYEIYWSSMRAAKLEQMRNMWSSSAPVVAAAMNMMVCYVCAMLMLGSFLGAPMTAVAVISMLYHSGRLAIWSNLEPKRRLSKDEKATCSHRYLSTPDGTMVWHEFMHLKVAPYFIPLYILCCVHPIGSVVTFCLLGVEEMLCDEKANTWLDYRFVHRANEVKRNCTCPFQHRYITPEPVRLHSICMPGYTARIWNKMCCKGSEVTEGACCEDCMSLMDGDLKAQYVYLAGQLDLDIGLHRVPPGCELQVGDETFIYEHHDAAVERLRRFVNKFAIDDEDLADMTDEPDLNWLRDTMMFGTYSQNGKKFGVICTCCGAFALHCQCATPHYIRKQLLEINTRKYKTVPDRRCIPECGSRFEEFVNVSKDMKDPVKCRGILSVCACRECSKMFWKCRCDVADPHFFRCVYTEEGEMSCRGDCVCCFR